MKASVTRQRLRVYYETLCFLRGSLRLSTSVVGCGFSSLNMICVDIQHSDRPIINKVKRGLSGKYLLFGYIL
ncbi:hypothetical protein J6590_078772 [Homalodisca vitripennis]|nr:hypothetical protein J6590_078772 [Homalodisca vitripennis]